MRASCACRWLSWCAALYLAACGTSDAPRGPVALCDPSAEGIAITEIMPYPQGGDTEQQWVELANFGAQPITLDRMVLSVGRPASLRHHVLQDLGSLAPGQLLVLGSGTPQVAPIDASIEGLRVPHEAGLVALHCRGVRKAGVVYAGSNDDAQSACAALDTKLGAAAGAPLAAQVRPCEMAPRARLGVSLSRDQDGDGRFFWHQSAGATYDGDNIGTPQQANLGYALCHDADKPWRSARAPKAGEVRIIAVYADPEGPDDGREWLVLRAEGPRAVDLIGLSLLAVTPGHKPRRWLLETKACWPILPGQERLVRVMTHKAPPGLVRAAVQAGELILWGPALPNQPMRLSLTFNTDASSISDAAPCDEVVLAKARCGVAFVRDAAPEAQPLWPPVSASPAAAPNAYP